MIFTDIILPTLGLVHPLEKNVKAAWTPHLLIRRLLHFRRTAHAQGFLSHHDSGGLCSSALGVTIGYVLRMYNLLMPFQSDTS